MRPAAVAGWVAGSRSLMPVGELGHAVAGEAQGQRGEVAWRGWGRAGRKTVALLKSWVGRAQGGLLGGRRLAVVGVAGGESLGGVAGAAGVTGGTVPAGGREGVAGRARTYRLGPCLHRGGARVGLACGCVGDGDPGVQAETGGAAAGGAEGEGKARWERAGGVPLAAAVRVLAVHLWGMEHPMSVGLLHDLRNCTNTPGTHTTRPWFQHHTRALDIGVSRACATTLLAGVIGKTLRCVARSSGQTPSTTCQSTQQHSTCM